MYYNIYIFRHGRTHFNVNGIFTGFKDSKLTKSGVEDAKIIALRLKGKKIDVAFQTSLSRSKDTLKEVLKFHPECKKVIIDDRLLERSYGILEGKSHYEIVKKLGYKKYDYIHRSYKGRALKGESIQMVEKRVYSFINDLIDYIKENKVNVAISAHGNSIRPFRRYFDKLTITEEIKLENPFDNYFVYRVKV